MTPDPRSHPANSPARANPDVALARGLGALTARLTRQRDLLLSTLVDAAVWLPILERVVAGAIDSFASLVPAFRGRPALQLLREEGAVRLMREVARCDPALLGRRIVDTLFSLRLSLLALERGAVMQPLPSTTGALDLFFHPSQRRAARRLLEERFGLADAGVRLDFTSAWRTGSGQLVRALDAHHAGRAFTDQADPSMRVLTAWLFGADCWVAGANPVSVAYMAAVQLAHARWEAGTNEFRQAITEALVVATRNDLPLDGLDDVNSSAWASVLSDDLLDWAASILDQFHSALHEPGGLATFRVFEFRRTLERAGKRGTRRCETIEEHLIRLTYKVVGPEVAARELRCDEHPGDRVPELFELRARIADAHLTKRQKQVLALYALDLDSKTVAEALRMKPVTARVTLMKLRRALGDKQRPKRRRH